MTQPITRAETTTMVALIRSLLAAGWRPDAVNRIAEDAGTDYSMIHPSGRALTAQTTPTDGIQLIADGLTVDQVAGALRGAGLTGAESVDSDDPRARLAAQLRQLADDIATTLPLPEYWLQVSACLATRADLDAWAAHLGTEVRLGGTGRDIPLAKITLPGPSPRLEISVQGPAEVSEVERLRARVAELEAQQAGGTA